MTTEMSDDEREVEETIDEPEVVEEEPVEDQGEEEDPEKPAPKHQEIPIHELSLQQLFESRIRSKNSTGVVYTNDELSYEMVEYCVLAGTLDAILAQTGASHADRALRIRNGLQMGFRRVGEPVAHLTPAMGDPSLAKANLKKPEKKKRKVKKRKSKRKRSFRESALRELERREKLEEHPDKTKDGEWVN